MKKFFASMKKALSGKHKDQQGKSKMTGASPKGGAAGGVADEVEAKPLEPLSSVVVDNLMLAMSYVTANFLEEEGLYRVPGKKEAADSLSSSMLKHPISASVVSKCGRRMHALTCSAPPMVVLANQHTRRSVDGRASRRPQPAATLLVPW